MGQPVVEHEELITRAERGWQLLADRYGPSWDDTIDLDSLRMEVCDACILGQLDGGAPESFALRLTELLTDYDLTTTPFVATELFCGNDDPEWHFVLAHGFETEGQYAPLAAAWREVILAHRAERAQGRLFVDAFSPRP